MVKFNLRCDMAVTKKSTLKKDKEMASYISELILKGYSESDANAIALDLNRKKNKKPKMKHGQY